jgi:hypothetical protein
MSSLPSNPSFPSFLVNAISELEFIIMLCERVIKNEFHSVMIRAYIHLVSKIMKTLWYGCYHLILDQSSH